MSRLKIERTNNATWEISIASGGYGEPGCRLRIQIPGIYITLRLPPLVTPQRNKVVATFWSEADIERMGRNWYWEVIDRRYGFYIFEGLLYVYLGRDTMDSSTTQRWSWFLPWTQWRHVRHSLYDLGHQHLCDLPEWRRGMDWFEHSRAQEGPKEAQPKANFRFLDFDGEQIKARCNIEEREWRRGTGCWKWLSWLYAPRVDRSLMLEFSSEVGRKKGSWKGGTVGHACNIEPGENPESAFRRYCEKQKLTFIGPCEPWTRPAPTQEPTA